jgi:hypothetical protein
MWLVGPNQALTNTVIWPGWKKPLTPSRMVIVFLCLLCCTL